MSTCTAMNKLVPTDVFDAKIARYMYEWKPTFDNPSISPKLVTEDGETYKLVWQLRCQLRCDDSCCYKKTHPEDHWDYLLSVMNYNNGKNIYVRARALIATNTDAQFVVVDEKFLTPNYVVKSFRELGFSNTPRTVRLKLEILTKPLQKKK